MADFDVSKLSNAGKEAARTHKTMRKTAVRLVDLVAEAKEAGMTPAQIEQALLKFCSDRQEMVDAVSLFEAAVMMREKGKL
jgi:hypothetical protein